MGIEPDFVRVIDRSPRVICQRCTVDMTLRTLVPAPDSNSALYTAGYRCPKCGTDNERQFKIDC